MSNNDDLAVADVAQEELNTPMPDDTSPVRQRAPRTKNKDVDALTWKPRENAPCLFRTCTFGHKVMVRSWNPLHARSQIAMFMLSEVVPEVAGVEEGRKIEKMLHERLDVIVSELEKESGRLQHLYKADGYDQIPAKNYPGAVTVNVPVYSPGAGRFLNVLTKVDDMLWLLDVLYLQGTIKLDTKFTILNKWKRLLWNHSRECNRIWISAKGMLQQVQEKDRAKRSGQAANSESAAAAA